MAYYTQTPNNGASTSILSQSGQQFIVDRACGCLLGQFIGDSMGSYLEFSKYQINRQQVQQALTMPGGGIFNLFPGQLTDDGELAIMQAIGILQCTQSNNINAYIISILMQYTEWMNSSPFDFGATMQNSWNPFLFKNLSNVPESEKPKLVEIIQNNVKKVSSQSQSNGFLMKQAPLGIFLYNQPIEVIFEFATQDTLLTHCNQFCIEISKLYVFIIAQLIKRGFPDSFKIYCEARKLAWDNQFTQQTKDIFGEVEKLYQGVEQQDFLSMVQKNKYKKQSNPIPQDKNIGWVKYAFTYSLMALISPPSNFNEFCEMVLIQGGDTDTNLCISLSVVGAMHGQNFFPQQIIDKVKGCSPSYNSLQKRDEKYRPSQYYTLAQDLINKGLNCYFQVKVDRFPKSKNSMDNASNQSNGNNINEEPLQVMSGSQLADTKNISINGKKINELTDCSVVLMENCEVEVIKNCYLQEIRNCKIGRILQSRVKEVQQSTIKTLESCLVASNESKFAYHKVSVGQIINSLFQQDID